MLKHLFAAATAALLAACESPGISDDYPDVYAVTRDQTLHVRNVSGRPLHYLIHERGELALILWGKCTPADEGCPVLPAGESLEIPYEQIGGYDPGDKEAVIYWWESRPDGDGGYRIVREDEVVVRL